jgi:uncharacterized membrane protein (UPF0127 family)
MARVRSTYALENRTRGSIVASRLRSADRVDQRLIGLMGKKRLPEWEALLIDPCNSIHCFFMRFPIDAVFVDREWKVRKVARRVRPWRIAFGGRGAHAVIELADGGASGVEVGDQLARIEVAPAQAA